MAGPVGWSIAAVAVAGGGFFASYKNKKAAEEATEIAKKITADIDKLRPKLIKLIELHDKTVKLKTDLNIALLVNTFPNDYLRFNEEQKNALATVINNARSMGELINSRVN